MPSNTPTSSGARKPYVINLLLSLLAWAAFALVHYNANGWTQLVAGVMLIAAVLNAVHHAETIAHRIGEPFGALVLALAVTMIEASIIVSLMLEANENASTVARDTVFAAVMIILNGMVGITILIGGIKFGNQVFTMQGVKSALTVLVAIATLTLVFPNFTQSVPGPFYSNSQLIFVAVVTLVLYFSFVFVQNFRHREDFLDHTDDDETGAKPSRKSVMFSFAMLPVNLGAVIMLAESLAAPLEDMVDRLGAPHSITGVVIAVIILLPEGIAATKAALKNQLQKSLNLSLGSALATIGLTIPAVSLISVFTGLPISLGLSGPSMVLFFLSFLVVNLSLSTGRTTILQGIVLLVIFLAYLAAILMP